MRRSTPAAICVFLLATACLTRAAAPFEGEPARPDTEIDRLVFARLRALGIPPPRLCSDAVFVRRAYLDVIGTLPTEDEARAFLLDRSPRKRAALIDHLLERPEFADYQAMKWGDLLRVKAEFPINLWPNAVQAYHRWIREAMRQNMPYDRFARELLTSSGSNFRVPPVNFMRAVQSKTPQGLAAAAALTFMGVRAEKWPPERLEAMAVFFSCVGYKPTTEWKEEIVFFDFTKAAALPHTVILPDGSTAALDRRRDPRQVFADWLISPSNPWFARNIVNRIWSWLLGRGIIHEPDDIRPDNPPVNPELLEYLQRELIRSGWDLKHIFRLILNSRTYQFSCIPPPGRHPAAEANFAYYPLRRLDAEVLIDAVCQITGTTEKYSSPIPEPFTFMPDNQRSIALPDGSVGSAFLELFGRPPRDTGLEAERNNRPTAGQWLHMLNSTHIQRKIEQSEKLRALARDSRMRPRQLIDRLYLTILSRFPEEEEMRAALRQLGSGGLLGARDAWVDIAWALMNTMEFQYRH